VKSPRSVVSALLAVFWVSAWCFFPAAHGAEATPGPTAAADEKTEVQVFYATDRKRGENKPAGETFGGERGETRFGRCAVQFTPIPFMDEVAKKVPFYVPTDIDEISSVEEMEPEEFWRLLPDSARETGTGSVVVFVHGYNYGFDRNCRMAAELQRSLAGKAIVLMFSWPSNAGPVEYVRDQADIEWSVPFLADLLARLGERIGPSSVQLLAHSLGARGSLFALERLGADLEVRPVIGRLVLMAPDFDSQTFLELLPRIVPLTVDITLYASSNDTPLKVSRQLSGYPRLGEGGELLTIAEGMETIDVSGSGRYQILGHEYFYYHPLAKEDLIALLTTSKDASQRAGLRMKTRDGASYWEIRWPEASD